MHPGEPSSCCAPSALRAETEKPAPRPGEGSHPPITITPAIRPDPLSGMQSLPGGTFLMGSVGPESWAADGEGPVRKVTVAPFAIDECAVTNAQFQNFITSTGYRTEAERFGWSFVHLSQLDKSRRRALEPHRVAGLEWWYQVHGATWSEPHGPGRKFQPDHPAVHITWHDATAYAQWLSARLPTEAEWEYAARGGLEGKIYPWGDELTPDRKHRCNIWQGQFPTEDRGDDGYRGTAPARSFKPNAYGLNNMVGNTWEWIADKFRAPGPPPVEDRRTMKGGSYLCHASYCNRYRCAARTSNTPDSSAGNIGFRCVVSLT